MIVILMGVSGSGKTTVGELLAERMGWKFADADDFHPEDNIQKMSEGLPLTDEDREPWLRALREYLIGIDEREEDLVLACSALKDEYRDELSVDRTLRFVYLSGSPELIQERLEARDGHFMPPELLQSQFDALEPPDDALQVDITPAPEEIVARIVSGLRLQA